MARRRARPGLESSAIESPTVRSLQRDLRKGRPAALRRFWTTVEKSGTPLVESPRGMRHTLLLTFLWKGTPGTKSVALRSSVCGWSPQAELSRLPGSDVWYRSFRVPNDLRDTYRFALDEPTVIPASGEEYFVRVKRWKLDPFNPKQFKETPDLEFPDDPADGVTYPSSLVELPRAPRRRELTPRKDVAKGAVQLHRLRSRILRDERRLWVYTPAGFKPGLPNLHLAIFFDGFYYTQEIPTPTILDNLAAANRLAPTVAVFVDARRSTKERVRDLCGRSPRFGRFLAKELVPWIERTLKIEARPSRTMLVGLSCGGLAALHWALRYPNRFRLVLSQSGAFQYPERGKTEPVGLSRIAMRLPRLPLRIYMEAGIYEGNYLLPGGTGVTLLSSNRHLRDVLRLKGYPLTYREFSGGHEVQCWQQSVVDGLTDLIGTQAT